MADEQGGQAPATTTSGWPSGRQYEIAAGAYRAVAVEVGGGLRLLTCDGRAVLDGFDAADMADGGRGQVLAPWPNRLRDGRWRWDGRDLQLPVNQPSTGTANHGLVRWSAWTVEAHTASSVALAHRLHPQPGYPFVLDLRSAYRLDPDAGLDVELTATNPGRGPVPVALGMHPYLAAPHGGLVDDCTLTVPARTRAQPDDAGIPFATVPVAGSPLDLRAGRRLDDQQLDDAYTDLEAAADGRSRVRLEAPDGAATELWTTGAARWLQVYTGDTLAPQRRRRGVAVEPMTAPAGALASGTDLAVLAPGEALTLRWGVAVAGR